MPADNSIGYLVAFCLGFIVPQIFKAEIDPLSGKIDIVFNILFTMAGLLVISILLLSLGLLSAKSSFLSYLPPLAISISSLLAATAVLKNIANTNKIEKEKAEKEKIRKISFAISLLKNIQESIDSLLIKNKSFLADRNSYGGSLHTVCVAFCEQLELSSGNIKESINMLCTEAVLSHFDNDLVQEIMKVTGEYVHFSEQYVLIKPFKTIGSINTSSLMDSANLIAKAYEEIGQQAEKVLQKLGVNQIQRSNI